VRSISAVSSGMLAFCVTSLALGCASTTAQRHSEAYGVLQRALQEIERNRSPVTIVLDPGLDRSGRRAASQLRPAIVPEQLPYSPEGALPAGYVKLYELTIQGDKAFVKATLGPVPRRGSLAASFACGETFELHLVKDATGVWRLSDSDLVFC